MKEGGTAKATYFLYSDTGLMGEANEQGQLTKVYAFNPVKAQQGLWSTDPVWQAEASGGSLTAQSSSFHYLHTDHLGTPMLATDKLGSTSWTAVAEAFGATGVLQSSSIAMNLRFPGQYWDGETGNHYNFHRDYKAGVGRYLEGDPIGLGGGLNIFSYPVSPLKKFDYQGLSGQTSNCDFEKCTEDPAIDRPCAVQCADAGSCAQCCHAQSRKIMLRGGSAIASGSNFITCNRLCNVLNGTGPSGPPPSPPPKYCKFLPFLCKTPKLTK